MSNTDSSASARLQQIKARTLATYHARNPAAREGGGSRSADASVVTARAPGLFPVVRQVESKPAQVAEGCCIAPCATVVAPMNVTKDGNTSGGDPYYVENYTWTPVPNATSYTFASPEPSMTFTDATNSSVTISYLWPGGQEPFPTFTITARNSCSSATSAPVTTNPCFLAGSLVAMADGTARPIEDIQCGDQVLGAFGEINTVLALHRPLLGQAKMIRINEEHSSTAHHPHIGPGRQFYCADVAALETATYGCEHEVLNAQGQPMQCMLHGLKPGRVQAYVLGTELKTVEGVRVLESLEYYGLPADTQLYNLVVSGSHTYHVDGYAVTGWPREDDFNYDVWEPIVADEAVSGWP